MRMKLFAGVAFAALLVPGAAFAQSTGSIDFEDESSEIVVTGTRANGTAGVDNPDTSKARAVLNQEFISRQVPGQTPLDLINYTPGVSFQNNDATGLAGGTLTIRGFDSSRISLTFDGIPLNDTGNYAIYSSQQLDSELIEQINVNLGSSDVDAPTAGATGSTVNYRSINPTEEFGAKVVGGAGDNDYFRVFGLINTGNLTSFGTRAWLSASHAETSTPYGNRGRLSRDQYNGKLYQPIGNGGDFVSVSGSYNEARNNFFGSLPLRQDLTQANGTPRNVGPDSSNRYPITREERYLYNIAACQLTPGGPGPQAANTCGSFFDERTNPSNTGSIRGASRFTLAEGLVLTVDPSWQYTKANGGGTTNAQEGLRDVNPTTVVSNQTGYIGGTPYFGRDLNGDGDILDQVRLLTPSQTKTRRTVVISSLRYELNDDHTVRLAYTFDRGVHRQTGETGLLFPNGVPRDVFPVNNPLADVNGNVLQKRDRKSYAILNKVAGAYRGEFFDNRLTLNLELAASFFKRDLTNFCFASNVTFVECFGSNTTGQAAYAAANPAIQGPQQRVFNYDKLQPNVGFTYDLVDRFSLFGNYSKGLQVPSTDNLYNTFFYAPNVPEAQPTAETADNFDLGVRYRSSKVTAQLVGWYTNYSNRLSQAFDPVLERSIYRNLGQVTRWGVDANIAWQPIPEFSLLAFGSYLNSEIKDDLLLTEIANVPFYARTAGKRESGSPVYTFGGRAQGVIGPLELGIQAKRTGKRYIYDDNLPVRAFVNGATVNVFGEAAPAYTLVDLDARVALDWAGLGDKTFFQLNVSNLFDEFYVGGFNGGIQAPTLNSSGAITGYAAPPFAQIGAPRTILGSLTVAF